jgi:dihydroorotase
MRTLLTHLRIVQPSGVRLGHLLIEDQHIAAILNDVTGVSADNVVDGEGAYALPGLVEVHGHMREPGLVHKEDYQTGTAAAAAGGYTVFLDMPNTQPPTTTRRRLQEKMDLANGRCAIDYAFIFGAAMDNQDELREVNTSDIVGVKFFTAGHETTPTTVTDLGTLYRSMRILADRDLLALVHAENQSLINTLTADMKRAGRDDGHAYCEARGEVVVATEVWNLVNLARTLGNRVYVCHVSTPGELEAIRWAQAHDVKLYGEAVVYHLVYSWDDCAKLGNRGKVSPALRPLEHQDALWTALTEGADGSGPVTVVESEHTPHLLEEKEGTIWQAASGMPGIQEALPQMITALRKRYPDTTLDERMRRVSLWMSTNPARLFGLSGKGELAVGNDADITLTHPTMPWQVQIGDLFTKCGWSAAEGETLYGRPTHTFVRGTLVYEQGKIVAPGTGRRVENGYRAV